MNKSNKSKIKKIPKRKEEWDNTISDLKSYKASEEEVLERKLSHQSKHQTLHFNSQNIDSDKPESVYDRLTKTRYGNKLKSNDISQRKDILKDMFIPDKELFELFSQSERALSNVENMFGDHKKRYRVTPSVTLAPDPDSFTKSSNNSNACALNDFSNSDNDELSSKTEERAVSDDLTKFRKFIEKEKKINDSLKNKLDEKRTVLIESVKKFDVGTETEFTKDTNEILKYINLRLENRIDKELKIVENDKVLSDKIIDHFEELEKKRTEEISALRLELYNSKELIDALTLELINNGQQMKRMKIETDSFMKGVSVELSQMKSYVLKYFDQQESIKTSCAISRPYVERQEFPCPNLADQLFKENFNLGNVHNRSFKDDCGLSEQLRQLQIDQDQTKRKLKNLMKIQNTITNVNSADSKID